MLFSWFLNEPFGYLLAQTPVFMRFIFFSDIVCIAHWGKKTAHRGPGQASEQSNYPRKWLYMKCLGYCFQISAITNVSVWQASVWCLNPPNKTHMLPRSKDFQASQCWVSQSQVGFLLLKWACKSLHSNTAISVSSIGFKRTVVKLKTCVKLWHSEA